MPAATEAPPAELLELSEAVSIVAPDGEAIIGPDKTVTVHVIRPGIGRGRGRHLYEADMLAENAAKFAGWKMYVDHRSREAQKAAGGLPRSVRDLGGRLLETWWDPTVPADPEKGWGAGAVVGKARPVKWLREMIEDDPELVETSISATATGVRPVTRNGQKVWLVEGIGDRGSVDWVTEAGAGGRVAPVLESAYSSEEDVEMALLEAMSDDEVVAYLRDERPHIISESHGDGEGGSTPTGEPVGGAPMPPEAPRNDDPEGGDMTITPEALREALQSSTEVQDFVRGLVESTLDEERELIRAEARADAQREILLTKLEVQAHRRIEESGLPDKWREAVKEQFALSEAGEPTPALDVLDEIDEFGNVVRSASDVLRESVDTEIARQRELLAEAAPTRVRGQGPSTPGKREQRKPGETGWGKFLQESVGVNPDRAFAIQGAGEDA